MYPALREVEPLGAIMDGVHDVPFLGQSTAERFRQRTIIFYDQKAHDRPSFHEPRRIIAPESDCTDSTFIQGSLCDQTVRVFTPPVSLMEMTIPCRLDDGWMTIRHVLPAHGPYTGRMDFYDVVHQRRMVRRFTDEPVTTEKIERIIEAAQHAPSAGFSQGVSFVVVTDPAIRHKVAEIAGEAEYISGGMHPFISGAPVQIIICTSEHVYKERYREPDKRPDPTTEEMEWPVPYWHTDAGCALMLILLAAVNEGLAGAFVGVWDQAGLQRLLGIPDDFIPIGVTMIGHGAPDVESPSLKRGRRKLGDVLHREHW